MSLVAVRVVAMVFYSTADPSYNTTPPTGSLTNSGWQWEGDWHGFLGTVVASNFFLTAQHVGGQIGDPFLFRGQSYPTRAVFRDTGSDLVLWQVCGTFPDYALLYETNNEVGKQCIMFGAGVPRGDPVQLTNSNQQVDLLGWFWGAGNTRLRWGLNTIIAPDPSQPDWQLGAAFDANGGPNEAGLSSGDSGGGWFIDDHGTWKLAGISYAVLGPFRFSPDGTSFDASLFDLRGLYMENESNVWVQVPDSPKPVPSTMYASRVSTRLSWLKSVLDAPSNQALPQVETSASVSGPFTVATNAVVDPTQNQIRLPLPTSDLFLRLNDCQTRHITAVHRDGNMLVLNYE